LLDYDQFGKIPIYVGITGHREMYERDILRSYDQIAELLQALKAKYPNTPIVAVTPLAEGADRILAVAAGNLGIPYLVPMPCRQSAYVGSFINSEAREEFHRLAEDAAACYAVEDTDQLGNEQYRKLGEHVARLSNILIAVHKRDIDPENPQDDKPEDGKKFGTKYVMQYWHGLQADRWTVTGLAAGTGESPQYTRRLFPIAVDRGDEACSSLAHLLQDRKTGMPTGDEDLSPMARQLLTAIRSGKKDPVLDKWNAFNADADRRIQHLHRSWNKHQATFAGLLESSETGRLQSDPPAPEDPHLTAIAMRYHTADQLSLHFARLRNRYHLRLSIMAFILSVLLFIYQNFSLYNSIFVYLLVFILSWAVYRWVTRQELHNKFIVYRSLAENLRILFYLRLLNHYPDAPFESHWKMNDTFRWINAAMTQQLQSCTGTAPVLPLNRALKLIRSNWVYGQADYYEKQAGKQEGLKKRQVRFKVMSTVTIIAVIVALAAVELVGMTDTAWIVKYSQSSFVRDNLLLIFSLVGLWIALINNYYQKMFAPETIRDYVQMHAIFRSVYARFPHDDILDRMDDESPDILRGLIGELHRLVQYAVNENDRWMNVKMEQDLELNL
jgi:hypothetical protein